MIFCIISVEESGRTPGAHLLRLASRKRQGAGPQAQKNSDSGGKGRTANAWRMTREVRATWCGINSAALNMRFSVFRHVFLNMSDIERDGSDQENGISFHVRDFANSCHEMGAICFLVSSFQFVASCEMFPAFRPQNLSNKC